jgi:GTP-binding protein
MFIDEAEIHVKAGDGGDGAVTFRREAGVPRGGPSGGDGGDGGDVIFHARPGMDTLLDFRGRHHWHAPDGAPGRSKDMAGPDGGDLVVDVPPGTLVYDKDLGILLKDLNEPGMRVVIARGGKGGRGNGRFATATHQTPRFAEPGRAGEERRLRLELKLIADVGLVGLPNAGKSTLLSRLSAARPKIANYPFTTLEPSLGIVQAGPERRFVMADLPGLIEGAHLGVGLGDEFLRHVERTRVLVHLVEIEPHTCRTPADAYRTLRNELAAYSPQLAEKPELVVLTKADLLPGDDTARREFSRQIQRPVIAISSATGVGLARLVKAILDLLDEVGARQAAAKAAEIAAPAPAVVPPHRRAMAAEPAAGTVLVSGRSEKRTVPVAPGAPAPQAETPALSRRRKPAVTSRSPRPSGRGLTSPAKPARAARLMSRSKPKTAGKKTKKPAKRTARKKP